MRTLNAITAQYVCVYTNILFNIIYDYVIYDDMLTIFFYNYRQAFDSVVDYAVKIITKYCTRVETSSSSGSSLATISVNVSDGST